MSAPSINCIGNPHLKNEPMFKPVFGKDWDNLPPVMKKRYANRPYTDDETVVNGILDVMCKPPLLWLAPLIKLLGQIPAYNAENVPVTVRFQSNKNSKYFHFNRVFNFSNRKSYIFRSRMLQTKDNEIIEVMQFGFFWKMYYAWDGEKVTLNHKGYGIKLFDYFIPLPLTTLMGTSSAEERPVDERRFDTEVKITHPWWGKIYEYKGRFEVEE